MKYFWHSSIPFDEWMSTLRYSLSSKQDLHWHDLLMLAITPFGEWLILYNRGNAWRLGDILTREELRNQWKSGKQTKDGGDAAGKINNRKLHVLWRFIAIQCHQHFHQVVNLHSPTLKALLSQSLTAMITDTVNGCNYWLLDWRSFWHRDNSL